MTQEVRLEKDTVVLDSEKTYSGMENPDAEEKLVRKAIGLPVKKQLVYYKDKADENSIVNVTSFRIEEMYEVSDRWYTIEIATAEGDVRRIHSAYLAEMQKPSFVSDMAAQSV